MEKPASELLVAPHVFGLTRELALRQMSWISSLFLYEPPKSRIFRWREKASRRRPPRWN